MQISSVVLEVWNRPTCTKQSTQEVKVCIPYGYKSPLIYSRVLIQLSRTLEYWPSPSSEMLKHQKGFGLGVVERSYRLT